MAIYAIYETATGTATARPVVGFVDLEGAAEVAEHELDAGTALVATTFDPIAIDDDDVYQDLTVNPSTGVVSTVGTVDTLAVRQGQMLEAIRLRRDEVAWTQSLASGLTDANRLGFKAYMAALDALPTSYAGWGTTPENVTFPGAPIPIYSNGPDQMLAGPPGGVDLIADDWEARSGTGTVTYPAVAGAISGRVLRVAGNTRRLHSPRRIPFDPSRLYRLKARLRRNGDAGNGGSVNTAGNFHLSVQGYNKAGDRITGTGSLGDSGVYIFSTVSQSTGFDGTAWVELVGYFKGTATSASRNGGSLASPSTMHADVATIGGMVSFNISIVDGSGATMELDTLDIDLAPVGAADIINSEIATILGSKITPASLGPAQFPNTARPVEVFAELPATGNFQGRIVFLTADSKLYRHTGSPTNASGFVSTVPAADISGTIAATQLAANIKPVEVLGALPATDLVDGRLVYLTTDKKVYRYRVADPALNITAGWSVEIDGGDIKALSITAGTIAVGAIGAEQIAAKAIVASKLFIGDTSNLFPDPEGADLASYSVSTGTLLQAGSGNGQVSTYYIRMAGTTTGIAEISTPAWPVEINKPYFHQCAAGRITGTGNATVRLYVDWFSDLAATALISSTQIGAQYVGISGAAQAQQATAPSTARRARFRAVKDADAGTGIYIQSPIVRRATNGELVVDGSIIADKLAADSVTANKIQAGEIGAAHIAAKAITAEKLRIGSTENLCPLWNFTDDLRGSTDASPSFLQTSPGTGVGFSFITDTLSGDRALRFTKGSAGATTTIYAGTSQLSACEAGAQYWVSITAKADQATTGGLYCRLRWYDADRNYISEPGLIENKALTTAYQPFDGKITAPANARFFSPRVWNNGNSVALTMNIDSVVVRQANAGQLLVEGAVVASHIAAGSITASKLLIGDTSNTFPDPDMNELALYSATVGTLSQITSPASTLSAFYIRMTASQTVALGISTPSWPVEASKPYFHQARIGRASGTGNASLTLFVDWFSDLAATALISSSQIDAQYVGAAAVDVSGQAVAPATARKARYRLAKAADSGTIDYLMSPIVRRAAGGELIVDGSIKAGHLETGALAVTGMAIFGDTLQSANFSDVDKTGWRLRNSTGLAGGAKLLEVYGNAYFGGDVQIDGSVILPNSVDFTKQAVQDRNNLSPEWDFIAPLASHFDPAGMVPTFELGAPTTGLSEYGKHVAKITNISTGNEHSVRSAVAYAFRVEPGAVYLVEGTLAFVGSGFNDLTVMGGIRLKWYNRDGAFLSNSSDAVVLYASIRAMPKAQGEVVAPASAYYAVVELRYTPTVARPYDLYIAEVKTRRAVTYREIGFEAIIEDNLADGAVTIDKLNSTLKQTSRYDATTPYAFMTAGSFGWGAMAGVANPLTAANLDTIQVSGVYSYSGNPTGSPSWSTSGLLIHYTRADWNAAFTSAVQEIISTDGRRGYRERVNGAWSAWTVDFTQANILGTVSQSAGVPTGALIEAGSNANGYYWRFAGGLQVCTQVMSIASGPNVAAGGVFASVENTWTLPIAFVSTTGASASAEARTTSTWWTKARVSATGTVTYRVFSTASSTSTVSTEFMAIGRWHT